MRTVVGEAGVLWRFYPVGRPDIAQGVSLSFEGVLYAVVFVSEAGDCGRFDLPEGKALGDLGHREILKIAQQVCEA